jgi:trimethylamine--corrinoid protein Co-methyltransferase
MDHFRTEFFSPVVTDRSSFDTWAAKGSKSLMTRAQDEVKRIFKEHSVEPLRNEVKDVAAKLVKKRAM